MDQTNSISQFEFFLNNVDSLIDETLTLNTEEIFHNAAKLFSSAERIFFTGSGSSIPAAMYGAMYLQMKTKLPASFWGTSQVLSSETLNNKDIIVLVSQGMNRADAYLIADKVKRSKAKFIVFTANTESELIKNSDLNFIFLPYKEKIFCRPSSVITSYVLMLKFLLKIVNKDLEINEVHKAIKDGFEKALKMPTLPRELNIVLSSGLGIPVATNVCLGFREGAGLEAMSHEIETYGHGWYVPDQILRKNGKDVGYIIIQHTKDASIVNAVKRITPLLEKTSSNLITWSTERSSEYGNIEILAREGKTLLEINKKTGYEMNNPPGMEENRSYHDNLVI